MTQSSLNIRLFVDKPLKNETCINLSFAQFHYVSNVMRLEAGDRIFLFNGKDGEWCGIIRSIDKKTCLVTVKDQTRPQTRGQGPWLAFSPVKKMRTDFMIEKATELGTQYFCPVFTKNTNSARIKISRLQMNAIGASEQCRRLTIPEIALPKSLEAFIKWWPRDRRLFVLDESGAGQPIIQALDDLCDEANGLFVECGFLTGPEGGFDASELAIFRELDFVVSIDLGPHILRAETAALSAIACWQAVIGISN